MIDESMDTEQMAQEPQPWEFRSKPAWQRLIIMTGGVIVNFILAAIIYIGLIFTYGEYTLPTDKIKDGVWVTDPELGAELGIRTGDKILAIDGNPLENLDRIGVELINGNSITIERDGKRIEKDMPVDFISKMIEKEDRAAFIFPRMPFYIGGIPEKSANYNSGLQAKDHVIRIGTQEITYFDEAKAALEQYKGRATEVEVVREGKHVQIPVQVSDTATLGVQRGRVELKDLDRLGYIELKHTEYGFFEAIPAGIKKGVTTLVDYVKNMKKIFNPDTGAYKGVGGFGTIANIFPDTFDWEAFWDRTALLSVILGFMNILPIPALDGGHVMFLLYEMVTGRKPSDKFLEYATLVGFVLLIALLLFANGNDVYKWLFK
jgi:regulator of sigma E protease